MCLQNFYQAGDKEKLAFISEFFFIVGVKTLHLKILKTLFCHCDEFVSAGLILVENPTIRATSF